MIDKEKKRFILVPNRIQPDLTVNDIVEVRRLEYLCRCHIILAHLTRRNQPDYEVLLQKAYWFVIRLWQVKRRGYVNRFFKSKIFFLSLAWFSG
jgi:hypothetical protein